MLCMRPHGPRACSQNRAVRRAVRHAEERLGGLEGGGECSQKMCVSDCLAGRVSALDWRNQVDRKGGSDRGQPELAGLKIPRKEKTG